MSITRWDPFRDLITLREAMDRLFEESFVRPGTRLAGTQDEGYCAVPIDIYATDEELVVVGVVPGAEPDDVDITIEGDTLTIRGEIKGPLENVNYIIQERACGRFQRTLRLNIPVQADKAEASFANGILTLTIPKQEESKPKTIKVKSK
jgi:HSP20 family protein